MFFNDASGQPLLVFHGTGKRFETFSGGRGAFYFTDDRKAADEYAWHAEGPTPVVVCAYLRMVNPLILDHDWFTQNVLCDYGSNWEAVDHMAQQAPKSGYDGLILKGFSDFDGMVDGNRVERHYDQYVVLHPDQILIVKIEEDTRILHIQS